MKEKLSLLWIFALLNYLYCDILTLMDPETIKMLMTGSVEGGPQLTPGFLFGAAILMEVPIAMVLLSRFLKYAANRWANIIAGSLMTVVQISTLFIGTSTMYYMFFSAIEITTTSFIVWLAWKWSKPSTEIA